MKIKGFDVDVVIKNGLLRYMITDETGIGIHCDMNELNKTIDELLAENNIH